MAVYAVGARTTNAPTATLPAISLYPAATIDFSCSRSGSPTPPPSPAPSASAD
jgi:hypothetical protein